mmetsp:Transcript_26051/g.41925  ORF Transcript_26051/g.41925 Transcript_26051/m.41925 type:complete len:400 (+) Transcript_26051:59-1258(+)|eukprot:jgi/Bigna1/88278/estExt_fgenesh1_pg.C_300038
MSFVNLGEADFLADFADLLKDFDESRTDELAKMAENKSGQGDLITKGYVSLLPKILENGKKSAIETSTAMAIAVASQMDSKDRGAAADAIKTALLENESKIDPLTLLSQLTSLFNLVEDAASKYQIFMAMGNRAKAANSTGWMLDKSILDRLDNFKPEWGLTPDEFSELLLMMLKLCQASSGKDAEFGELLLKYLASLDGGEESKQIVCDAQVKEWTITAVVNTFTAPFEMANRMRRMASLGAVKTLSTTKDGPLVDLLSIYVDEDFKRYLEFAAKKENLEYMESRGIAHEENVNHFRVFAACKLPLGEYTYEAMQKVLQVPNKEDIEGAVIGLVLTKKVDARIDQARECIHIRHTAQREFRDAQWSQLGKQLGKWKEGVKGVLTSLYKARQQQKQTQM